MFERVKACLVILFWGKKKPSEMSCTQVTKELSKPFLALQIMPALRQSLVVVLASYEGICQRCKPKPDSNVDTCEWRIEKARVLKAIAEIDKHHLVEEVFLT